MRKLEILAPAGGKEQLVAAVRAGADAVYLGTKAFNARQRAENFGENLAGIIGYCHARNVKVNVTVNTLVRDSEMELLRETCDLVASSGADRAIVQDLAVYRYFREAYPTLQLSASTQMAVHNVDGARQLEDMGYSCIVLARELTLEEMRKICSAVSVECEAFIHGAHCMSVSGACYLSAMLGGRSGNRGLCAQPCRMDFKNGRRDYALSLRDMSLLSHMREMGEAGVTSFKIEGRMKRAEYVAAVTDACVRARDGMPYDGQLLADVFSRGGFTDGYLMGRRDARMFGRRSEEDKEKSEEAMPRLRELYRAERCGVPFAAKLELGRGASRLTVSDGKRSVSLDGPAPQEPLTRATGREDAERAMGKTGGTPFILNGAQVDNPLSLVLPGAAMNALRRDALGKLLEEREKPEPHEKRPFGFEIPFPHAPRETRFVSVCRTREQARTVSSSDAIALPVALIGEEDVQAFGGKLIAYLPHICFPDAEDALRESVRRAVANGVRRALCDNLYAIRMAKEAGMEPLGGFGLNIMNGIALAEYGKLGVTGAVLSFELPLAEGKRIGGEMPRGVMAYGYLPLMRMRSCPGRTEKGCGNCTGHPVLTDRLGVTFPVLCEDRRYSTLLNSVPLDLLGRDLRAFDHAILFFTTEEPGACAEVLRRARAGEKSTSPHTTGLAYKELP